MSNMSFGKSAVALVLSGAAILGLERATRVEIPEGKLGMTGDPHGDVILQSGSYTLGELRFPDRRIVEPGETLTQKVDLVFTPGQLDKLANWGRQSLLVNILPVVGDWSRERVTKQLNLKLDVEYVTPSAEGLRRMAVYGDSIDLDQAISRACKAALLPEEDKIGRRFFAPSSGTLEEAVSAYLTETLGLEVKSVIISDQEFVRTNSLGVNIRDRAEVK